MKTRSPPNALRATTLTEGSVFSVALSEDEARGRRNNLGTRRAVGRVLCGPCGLLGGRTHLWRLLQQRTVALLEGQSKHSCHPWMLRTPGQSQPINAQRCDELKGSSSHFPFHGYYGDDELVASGRSLENARQAHARLASMRNVRLECHFSPRRMDPSTIATRRVHGLALVRQIRRKHPSARHERSNDSIRPLRMIHPASAKITRL